MTEKRNPPLDQDGKSKTASAADEIAYPEQNEVRDQTPGPPSPGEIREKAHELWVKRGAPGDGPSATDIQSARRELHAPRLKRTDLREHREDEGSVQP